MWNGGICVVIIMYCGIAGLALTAISGMTVIILLIKRHKLRGFHKYLRNAMIGMVVGVAAYEIAVTSIPVFWPDASEGEIHGG